MKSNWKKLLSLALVLALMLGFAPGISMPVYASDAAIDIGNSNASGMHWSYDASTHTLTLNGYDYNGSGDGLIYSGSSALTINLIGTNRIITTGNNDRHGICCRTNGAAVTFSGEGSLDVSATGNGIGIYFVGDMEFAGGTVSFSGNTGIYNHDHHVTVSGGEVHATGTNCGVYTKNGGKLSITGGKLVATGGNGAIKQDNSPNGVLNSIAGTGWTDTNGTEGKADIPISTEGQTLTYKKVQFPADPAAGGTATEYAALVNTTTTVRFNNMDWYIIADNSTAADAGTVTLLVKDPIGASKFNNADNDGNGYHGSVVENYLKGLTDAGGAFAGVSDAIAATDLSDVGVTAAKLYLLSVTEANALSINIRKCSPGNSSDYDYDQWWLRSPGTVTNGAQLVHSDDGTVHNDINVTYNMRVRPALRLDLSKVTFSNNTFALPVPPVASGTSGGTTSVTVSTADEFKTAVGNGGTITLSASFELPLNWGLGFTENVTIDLNGKTITVSGSDTGYTDFKLEKDSVALTIKDSVGGGEIILPKGIEGQQGGFLIANSTSLTLESGTLHFTGAGNKGIIFNGGGSFTMTGGMIDSVGNSVYGNGGRVAISGGTVKGGFTGFTGNLTITGGSFSFDPTAYLGNSGDYAASKTGDYWVVGPVSYAAQVGETSYTTFAAALGAWTDGSTLTLLDDVTTSSTIKVTGTQILDLNGHGITKTGGDNVIWITGGDLTVNDSDTTTTHYFDVRDGMAVNVNATSGEKSFSGGYITGGTGQYFDGYFGEEGGGVYVDGGSFTLCGGTILGNSVNADNGGGVGIYSGTMTMHGGTICYNKGYGVAHRSGSSGNNRGGGATTTDFVMYDGVIANNTKNGVISSGWWSYGVDSDTFYGGTIINNGGWGIHAEKLTIAGNVTVSGNENGVGFSSSASISSNPTISDNTNSNLNVGGKTIDVTGALTNTTPIGVTMASPGVFTTGETAYNDATKFVSDDAGYAVFKNSSDQLELRVPPAASVTSGGMTTEYMAFADALTAWADGSTLTLLSDVTTGSTISVSSGTKTLNLNGHGIKATGTGYSVITVGSGASLTLNDSDLNGAHNTQTFTGGYITGGNTANNGGGVLINGGSLTMNGGTIKDNNAYDGGGVYVVSGATLRMTGGAIEGNRATHNGAGVAVEGGATFQMSGGAIRYNACNGDTGGVLLRADSANFTMSGGSIQYNTGGAIGGIGSFEAQPKFSGAPVVKDNVKGGTVSNTGTGYILEGGTPCNAYNINSVIAIVGALQDGAEIGMTIQNGGVGVFTGSTDTSFNDPTKFVSDNASYAVGKNADGQLLLGAPVTVTFDTKGGSAVDAQTVASGSLVTEPAAPTKTNDTFAGWYTDETYTTAFDFGTMIVDTDTTLCAQWASKPVHTVSGTVKQGDAAVSGVDVRLVQGERVIAVTETNTAGEFSVSASDGIYNIVAATVGKTKTELVTLNAAQTVDIVLPTENVNSTLTVTGSEIKNVMVGGLDELAEANSASGQAVTVTMTVKEDAANKSNIQEIAAANQSLDCLEIKIEKKVGSGAAEDVTDTGSKVLEIVVPYRFTGKKDVEVYRYHGSVEKLKKEDSKADGTYRTDENNGLIYIYASKFSTYAIGFTQLYTVACPIDYESYTGTVTVSLLDASDNVVASHAIDVNNGSGTYSFSGVPEGEYKLRAVWTEGEKEMTLNGSLNVQ